MQTTARLTFAAALAVVSIRLVEHGLHVQLNGTTAEVTGAVTIIWERVLRWCGLVEQQNDGPDT